MSSEVYESADEVQDYVLKEFGELYNMATVANIFQASEALLDEEGSISEEDIEDVVVNLEEYRARFGLR